MHRTLYYTQRHIIRTIFKHVRHQAMPTKLKYDPSSNKMETNTEARPLTPDVSLMLETQYRVYDGVLAVGFCFCFIVGLPGNILALKFFLQSGKRNLPTLLYITASSIDMVSSVIHLPIIMNLLNKRDPGLFKQELFCTVWYFLLLTVQFMSMFVVMLLSLNRAIVIVSPFYKVNKKAVLISIPVALIYISAWNTTYIVLGNLYYSRGYGYCSTHFNGVTLFYHLFWANYSFCVGSPPTIVFLATFVTIFKLKKKSNVAKASGQKNRQASMTIIYFAVVFLACNLLTFLNLALYAYSRISSYGYVNMYSNTFLFFYSWIISDIFCMVLNAATNPILYMCRMKEMRLWFWSLFGFRQADLG